ncbi:MAG: hypothetical protein U0175_33535, partial [Caldilineaceae bacterium]
SPRDWLLASRAYAQLALEEPDQMANFMQNDPQRQARLNEIGTDLETAMTNLSTLATTTGPEGNSLLFTTIITNYKDKLDAIDSKEQGVESGLLKEVRENRLQRAESFDPFGGITQTVTYVTPELGTLTCGNPDVNGSFPAPSNMQPHIPNFDHFNFADYLRQGKITVCISDDWTDVHDICNPQAGLAPDALCPQFFGKHRAFISVNYDNVAILTKWVTDPGDSKLDTASQKTKVNWTTGKNYKAQFETLFATTTPSGDMTPQQAQLLDATLAKIEKALGDYQVELYGRIINEMSLGSLKSSATELDGSKAMLEAMVTLGLPRAVSSDEFFHAMLFGDQQLVDSNQILQTYALSATAPITGGNLFINPRLVIGQIAQQRIDVFADMIKEYLDGISAETHAEAPDYIANTRQALDLTLRIVKLETQPQVSNESLYLPLVTR